MAQPAIKRQTLKSVIFLMERQVPDTLYLPVLFFLHCCLSRAPQEMPHYGRGSGNHGRGDHYIIIRNINSPGDNHDFSSPWTGYEPAITTSALNSFLILSASLLKTFSPLRQVMHDSCLKGIPDSAAQAPVRRGIMNGRIHGPLITEPDIGITQRNLEEPG